MDNLNLSSIFGGTIGGMGALNAFMKSNSDNEVLYAKHLIETIFANSIYKEDFEVAEGDSCAARFTEGLMILDSKLVSKIVEATKPQRLDIRDVKSVKELAEDTAESLIKITFEDATLQMKESHRIAEEGKMLNTGFVPLMKQVQEVKEMELTENGDVQNALVNSLDDKSKLDLAVKYYVFENALKSAGVPVDDFKVKNYIDDKREMALF